MTLFGFLYAIGLHVYACASLPKIFLNPKKYRGNFLRRLGFSFPKIEKGDRQLIWVHAVSLGETKAILPLIQRLKSEESPPLILLSTSTQTGFEEGRKHDRIVDYHVFLPFDFSYVIRPIVKQVAPDVLLLTETDFWYNFQDAAKKLGAKILLINGKISERSFNRLAKFPFLARRLLSPLDHFFVQGEVYRKRFAELSVAPSRLSVTGNIKLDSSINLIDISQFKQQLKLDLQPVLTLGSTHDPEEKIWCAALKKIWQEFPHLKVLLVPRHPERFDTVAKYLENEKIPFSRLSQKGTFQTSSILLVDAMGILRSCYQISTLTFVGGSLTPKVGGHNILEPSFYGKPVLFGPYMYSQPDLLELAKNFHAGLQITEETLVPTVQKLLKAPELASQIGRNGEQLINTSRGALEKTFSSLIHLLQK
jgi:3-deoxy-D-manno-octulosonic-acid transferase